MNGDDDIMDKFNQDVELFESWEADHELIEKKDYEGLIKYRKECLDRHPNDSNSKWGLGEAYVMAKKYQIALDYFISIYQESFDDPNVQYSILDALFGLGKNENDFEWIEKPDVLRIEEAILLCKKMIKGKRKYISIDELYCDLMIKGYLNFNEKDLFIALGSDDEIDVIREELEILSTVKLKRRRKISK